MDYQKEITAMAKQAKAISLQLAGLSNTKRNEILLNIATNLRNNREAILEANKKDQTAAQAMMAKGELTQALYDRLVLNDKKIEQLSVYLEEVARQEDPINQCEWAKELSKGLNLYRYSCPIGSLAVIFESRPEVVVQITALTIKSGNTVILKGGTEAKYSNRMLYDIIQQILQSYQLQETVNLLETRESVAALLACEEYVDLIIPRGSNQFVKYIQSNTNISVLGHSSGICHIYLDKEIDESQIIDLVCDSKTDYPSACNAVETVLVHQEIAKKVLPSLCIALQEKKVGVRLDKIGQTMYSNENIKTAAEEDWSLEYSDLIISIKIVNSLEEAIQHINTYGSHHTDSIVTTNQVTADTFFKLIDSACVFHNTSTRFSDGYVFGLGAEVGISTNKTHARGPVGLEGLVIYKYKLVGKGHIRAPFNQGSKKYTHKQL